MSISFVSKVAPPKYKGMMMGGWFAATAIGNYLVSVPGLLWMRIPLWAIWVVLIAICIIAGVFMFANMKRIESATV
jgi:POT family proton-dependent oligopeptide transporter